MKRVLYFGLFAIVALAIGLVPQTADAFVLTASDFNGALAYDSGNDVIGTYGLDQRFSYENTGMYFNTAATMNFSFVYDPVYPSIEEVIANPSTNWNWDVQIRNFTNPLTGGTSSAGASRIASYDDMLVGVSWAETMLDNLVGYDAFYQFDYSFSSPTTGMGSLSLVGNLDPSYFNDDLPGQWIKEFRSDLEISVAAEPVPEPLTLSLFGLGLAGLGLTRKMKKK